MGSSHSAGRLRAVLPVIFATGLDHVGTRVEFRGRHHQPRQAMRLFPRSFTNDGGRWRGAPREQLPASLSCRAWGRRNRGGAAEPVAHRASRLRKMTRAISSHSNRWCMPVSCRDLSRSTSKRIYICGWRAYEIVRHGFRSEFSPASAVLKRSQEATPKTKGPGIARRGLGYRVVERQQFASCIASNSRRQTDLCSTEFQW